MVWQARTGSIFHGVRSALGQDWRQETKQAADAGDAAWYRELGMGWDELDSVQGLQGGLWSAQCLPSCQSGLGAMALLSSFSLHCLPLAQLKSK